MDPATQDSPPWREIGERLLARLDYFRLRPAVVLHLNAGAAQDCRDALVTRFPAAQVIAPPGDACDEGVLSLPLPPASVDCIVSHLALHRRRDVAQALREMHRVLRPGGLLLFSAFGLDTWKELHACEASAAHFLEMHTVGDEMLRAGFQRPVVERELLTVLYSDVAALLQERNAMMGGESPTAAGLERLRGAYEPFRCEGRLPATLEVIYGCGFCAAGVARRLAATPSA